MLYGGGTYGSLSYGSRLSGTSTAITIRPKGPRTTLLTASSRRTVLISKERYSTLRTTLSTITII